MADHHGNLAEVEEGRSLLPEIVQTEEALKQRLADAKAEAEKLVREAKDGAAKAIEAAKAGFPTREDEYLQGEVKKFEGELEELGESEKARLEALRKDAETRVADAAKAVAALALKTSE